MSKSNVDLGYQSFRDQHDKIKYQCYELQRQNVELQEERAVMSSYLPNKTISLIDAMFMLDSDDIPKVIEGPEFKEGDDLFVVIEVGVNNVGMSNAYLFINTINHKEIYKIDGKYSHQDVISGKFAIKPAIGCSKEFIDDISFWIPRLVDKAVMSLRMIPKAQ